MSQLHYEKATNILGNLNESTDYLKIQLESIGLQEFLAESKFTFYITKKLFQNILLDSKSQPNKLQHFTTALSFCLKAQPIFEHISKSKTVAANDTIDLMKLFSSRLQVILKHIIKLVLSAKDHHQKKSNFYKEMYLKSLKISAADEEKVFAGKMANALKEINKIVQDENFNKI